MRGAAVGLIKTPVSSRISHCVSFPRVASSCAPVFPVGPHQPAQCVTFSANRILLSRNRETPKAAAAGMGTVVSPDHTSRKYDLIVVGATGFTGQLVVEHIAREYPSKDAKFTWAIAGRHSSREKLEKVRAQVAMDLDPQLADGLDILTYDVEETASVDALCVQARVIISTAGPFARMGTSLVDGCVRSSTHYVDITGEIPWVRRMISKHDTEARSRGVRIVHECGFDCVPQDIGVHYLALECARRGLTLGPTEGVLRDSRGGVSGGTVVSAMGIAQSERQELQSMTNDPLYLVPPTSSEIPKGRTMAAADDDDDQDLHAPLVGKGDADLSTPPLDLPAIRERLIAARPSSSLWTGWYELSQTMTAPFIMSGVVIPTVYRSLVLSQKSAAAAAGGAASTTNVVSPYGPRFSYKEAQAVGGVVGAVVGCMVYILIGLMIAVPWLAPITRLLAPKPGQGPSLETQLNGMMFYTFTGQTEEEGQVAVASLQDEGRDPGYRGTARMLLECALCMVLDKDKLAESNRQGKTTSGGILTPAAAFGEVLIDRLREAGFRFSFELKQPVSSSSSSSSSPPPS